MPRVLRIGLRRVSLLIGGLAFCVLVLAAGVTIRLAQGPVSLGRLAPVIENVLNGLNPSLKAAIGDVILRWDGWEHGINLRLTDVRLKSADGMPVASIPELGIAISNQSIRDGRLLIEGVEIFRPALRLILHPDGRFDVVVTDGSEPSDQAVTLTLADLAAPPDPATPASYLRTVNVTDGQLTLVNEAGDQLAQLRIDSGGFARAGDSLSMHAGLVLGVDKHAARLDLLAHYRRTDDILDLAARFRDVNPAQLAAALPTLATLPALSVVDLPLAGEGSAIFDGGGAWRTARLDVTSGAGRLVVPPEFAEQLAMPLLAQALTVREAHTRIALDRQQAALTVEALDVQFAPGTTLFIPPPADHRFPLTGLQASGRIEADRVDLETLVADLGGPKLTANGTASGLATKPVFAARVAVDGLAVDALRRYWPPSMVPGGYEWTVTHLSGGVVPRAEVMLTGTSAAGPLAIEKLEGSIVAEGVTVDYLAPLPPVRNTAAKASFNLSQFKIDIERGNALNLNLTGGTVVIGNFDKPAETIDLDLTVVGPVSDALEILSRKPLQYTEALGIDPSKVSGEAEARLKLAFPLLRDLPWSKITVAADVHMKDVGIDGLIAGQPLSNGDLTLHADKAGLDLGGSLAIAGIAGRALVAMNFAGKAPTRSRIEFTSNRFAVEQMLRLVPDQPMLRSALQAGDLAGKLSFVTARDGSQTLAVRIDATQAQLALPPLGWHKKRGAKTTLDIDAGIKDQRLVRIPRIACTADDLDIHGSALFGGDGAFRSLDLGHVEHGRTDIAASVQRHDDGSLEVAINGPTIDLEPLLALAQDQGATPAGTELGGLRLAVDVNEAWLATNRKLNTLSGTAARAAVGWTQVALAAEVPDGGRLSVAVTPAPPARRHVRIEADDAGKALSTLGLYTDMRRGRFELDAHFYDAQPESPLSGRLKIKDFTIVKAPLLARLLNILALSGILDALRGDGISFSTLDAPFVLTPGELALSNAKSYGAALGLTASGTVKTTAETIDVQGTIVPFYVINAALGRIPLIGDLFTGGEAGGGVFAATYSMKGALAEPAVSVNPLSILGPGVLRHLFSIFDPLWSGGSDTTTPAQLPEGEPSSP